MSSGISPGDIYIGFWINWSQGKVFGSTVTVTTPTATFLVAFLALFVQAVGANLWDISIFVFHQSRATLQQRDAFHWQQQVIFRNSSTPAAALWDLLKVGWAWRHLSRRPYLRTLPVATLALLYIVGFILAGILSSQLVNTSGVEVLTNSPFCGYWGLNGTLDYRNSSVLEASLFYMQLISDSSSYARSCYNASSGTQCNTFANRRIDWVSSYNATCPFAQEMCIGTNEAIRMDTGRIDSHSMLGINAAEEDRVSYRRVTTCAPIATEGCWKWVNASDSAEFLPPKTAALPGEKWAQYYYGQETHVTPSNSLPADWTFRIHEFAINLTDQYSLESAPILFFLGSIANKISNLIHLAGRDDWSEFAPIPEMSREDADVTLFFLQGNRILLTEPSDDPLFSAHRVVGPNAMNDKALYRFDNPAGVLGCAEQHQFCAHNNCTPLTGVSPAYQSAKQLGANPQQLSTFDFLYHLLGPEGPIGWIVDTGIAAVSDITPPPIKASETLLGGSLIQLALPSNQWAIEVEDWHALAMAFLQNLVVSYAIRPPKPDEQQYPIPPNTTEARHLCSQIVRSDGRHASINVFALMLVLSIGCLIILLNLSLAIGIGWHQRRRGRLSERQCAWINDEALHLQRMAYERSGVGRWNSAGMVPTTTTAAGGERMDPLTALSGHGSPVYSPPSSSFSLVQKFPFRLKAAATWTSFASRSTYR